MKLFKLLFTVLITMACAVGAHAQKQLKYLSEAVTSRPVIRMPLNVRAGVTLPACPPLTAAGQEAQRQAARAMLGTAVERQVTARLNTVADNSMASAITSAGLDLQLGFLMTLPQGMRREDFLTGPQALVSYLPGWRSEMRLEGFSEEQLNIFERTFAQTDAELFKLDNTGKWLAPADGSTAWEYENWFAVRLQQQLGGLTRKQHLFLFGKFARMAPVFARLNLQAFVLVHQRAPKAGAAGEEGKLARHVKHYLESRHPKMNREVEGYIYGKMPAKLKTPAPSYGPKGRAPRRTPDEVYEQTVQFIKENGSFPLRDSKNAEERSLRKAFDKACKKAEAQNLQDGTSLRLLALKEQWVKQIAEDRTPQQVLVQTEQFIKENGYFPSRYPENAEERSLRQAFDYACRKAEAQNLQDGTSLRLLALKEQWVKQIAEDRTSQQVLVQTEQFVKENGYFPSQNSENAEEGSLRKAFDYACKKAEAENLQDGTSLRLLTLKEQWVKQIAEDRTLQQVLVQTEQFIKENGYFPSRYPENAEERSLRQAFDYACRKAEAQNLQDGTSLKLLALKAQWVKTPSQKAEE